MQETVLDSYNLSDRSRWAVIVMSAVVVLYTLGFVVHIGRLSFFLGPSGRTVTIGVELAMVVVGAGACIALRLYWALVAGALVTLYPVAQTLLFARNFGVDINLPALSGYYGWMSVLVFAPAFRVLAPERLVNLLFGVALVYAAFYLLLSLRVPGFEPPSGEGELLSLHSDDEIGRPSRFVMLSSMMAFGSYVSVTRIVRDRSWGYVASAILFGAGIWLSYSRVATLMIVAVALAYVATRHVRLIGWGSLAAFVTGAATLVIGLFVSGFHPFDVFGSHDLSAVARSWQYDILRQLMPDYWLLGVGFSPSPAATSAAVSYGWFYSADLGAAGVFYEGGLVGLMLFSGMAMINVLPGERLERLGFRTPDSEALALTGCACAMFGVLWPELWNGTGSIYAGLFLAVALVPSTESDRAQSHEDAV